MLEANACACACVAVVVILDHCDADWSVRARAVYFVARHCVSIDLWWRCLAVVVLFLGEKVGLSLVDGPHMALLQGL